MQSYNVNTKTKHDKKVDIYSVFCETRQVYILSQVLQHLMGYATVFFVDCIEGKERQDTPLRISPCN